MFTVELKNKQNGKTFKHPATFFPRDRWLEIRPFRAAFMTHQLDSKVIADFLAGRQVSMSYTYWVTKISD